MEIVGEKTLKCGVKYYYTRGLPINYNKGYKVTFKLTYTRSIEYYTLFDKIIIILGHKVMNKLCIYKYIRFLNVLSYFNLFF